MTSATSTVEVKLSKPMGIIFEENDPAKGGGIYVFEVADGGNAASLGTINLGDVLLSVDGKSAAGLDFDSAMQILIDAPESDVTLAFSREGAAAVEEPASAPAAPSTAPMLTVVQGDGTQSISAESGDRLRNVLLSSKCELYGGMDKLMNCGGVGQCGTCVVDILEAEPGALNDRTDVEEKKLKKRAPSTRLACMTVLQGGDVKLKVRP